MRQARRVELVTLAGEAGIGKSRLVRELARLAAPDAQVLIGHCPAYGDGVTYWPLREMVLQAVRGRDADLGHAVDRRRARGGRDDRGDCRPGW